MRDVRAAAAEMDRERLADLVVGRIGILVEQRRGADDHPRDAVAALRGFLVDERLLDRMELVGRRRALRW